MRMRIYLEFNCLPQRRHSNHLTNHLVLAELLYRVDEATQAVIAEGLYSPRNTHLVFREHTGQIGIA